MKTHVKCFVRSKEILLLLKEHGPLSFRAIKLMLNPPMSDNALHAAIFRLTTRGIVNKRFEKVFRGHGTFYQLAQNEEARTDCSKIIKCLPETLEQPAFRYRELIHSQACGIWAHQFKQLFPSAEIVNDFNFSNHALAKNIMLSDGSESEVKPDLLIILKNESLSKPVYIAVEIEKTRKTDKRILNKIYKYSKGSFVDGLIYACESDSLKEVVRTLYQNKFIAKALRAEHYKNNFFMFSTATDVHITCIKNLYNSNNEPVLLTDWVEYILETTFEMRRDSNFKTRGVSTTSSVDN